MSRLYEASGLKALQVGSSAQSPIETLGIWSAEDRRNQNTGQTSRYDVIPARHFLHIGNSHMDEMSHLPLEQRQFVALRSALVVRL